MKVNKWISKLEEFILSTSIIVMALLLIFSVIMRAIFNSSLTFAEEVGQTLMLIVTFFGISYCAKKGRHITMSIIFDMVDNNKKKIFMYVIAIFSSAALFLLTYIGIDYTISTMKLARVTPALQIPIYLLYMFVPLGFLLGAIEYLTIFILNVKDKENLYLTSEIKIPMDAEIKVDLNTLIEEELYEGGKIK